MKRIICYQTLDGAIHQSTYDADRHADKAYGEALHLLAVKITKLNYSECKLTLDESIELMRNIIALKDDTEIQTDEETDED